MILTTILPGENCNHPNFSNKETNHVSCILFPLTVSRQHSAIELRSSLMRAMHGFLLLTLKKPFTSPNAAMKQLACRKLSFIFPCSAKPVFLKTPRLSLPQDLCTCYSSCTELCSSDLYKHSSFIAFRLFQYHYSKFQYHYFLPSLSTCAQSLYIPLPGLFYLLFSVSPIRI